MPKDKHLESVLLSTFRRIILTRTFPRTLIQLTLQVLKTPSREELPLPEQFLESVRSQLLARNEADCILQTIPLLPPLITAAYLTLLAANIPMSTVILPSLALSTSNPQKSKSHADVLVFPSHTDHPHTGAAVVAFAEKATSLHSLAFSRHGELLLTESEGDFSITEWEAVAGEAEKWCASLQHGEAVGESTEDVPAGQGRKFLLDLLRESRSGAAVV